MYKTLCIFHNFRDENSRLEIEVRIFPFGTIQINSLFPILVWFWANSEIILLCTSMFLMVNSDNSHKWTLNPHHQLKTTKGQVVDSMAKSC